MHWLDPDYLPQTKGRIAQFLINPHGEIDGMILQGGQEIHFPPHLSSSIARAAKIGEPVAIRGIKPRGGDVIAGVALDVAGRRILDNGPPEDHKQKRKALRIPRKDAELEGVVVQVLHGPKGENRGLLLEGGHTIRFPKHAAKEIHPFTIAGAKIAMRGPAIKNSHGSTVEAHAVGRTLASLKPVAPKPPKPG